MAVRWYASAFLADKLTLYPGRSLVHNIGNDSSGTHCGSTAIHDASLSVTPINLGVIEVRPSEEGSKAFEVFFWRMKRNLFQRTASKLNNLLKMNF